MIKKYPLVFYFLFTYLLSWFFWTIPIFLSLGIYKNESLNSFFGLGVLAPIIVSAVLTQKRFGGKGIRDLTSRLRVNNVPFRWYLIAALTFMGLSIGTLVIYSLIHKIPVKVLHDYSYSSYLSMMPVFLIFATFEEVGWRGFALPRIRETHNPISSSFILGVIWWIWHFPKLISEGTTDINSFIVLMFFAVLFSLFMSWIYENNHGSISLAILAHAAGNSAIYAINPGVLLKIGYNEASIIYVMILFSFMVFVVMTHGPDLQDSHKCSRWKQIIPRW
jgi:membrane protease YdiL (CAAX protease family)